MVLGGDGFCGWPSVLHLSAAGYDVAIFDNLSPRQIEVELECESLTPIRPLGQRLDTWARLTGRVIPHHRFDLACHYQHLVDLILEWRPATVVHCAEQRAAVYSMKSAYQKLYTMENNLGATQNLLTAPVETGLDAHLVHLNTMGMHGYGSVGMKIPEGYLKVAVETDCGEHAENEILYPAHPGSIYHLTKSQDKLSFYFFNNKDGVRVT